MAGVRRLANLWVRESIGLETPLAHMKAVCCMDILLWVVLTQIPTLVYPSMRRCLESSFRKAFRDDPFAYHRAREGGKG